MKSIIAMIHLTHIRESLLTIFRRFPVGIFFIGIVSALLGWVVYTDNFTKLPYPLYEGVYTGIAAFFLTIGLTLATEHLKLRAKILWQLPVVAFAAAFFWTLHETGIESRTSILTIWLTLVCFGSLLFVAPYLTDIRKWKVNRESYTEYLYKICIAIGLAIIVGVLAFILGAIAIGATFSLFSLDFIRSDTMIAYWAIFSFCIAAPLLALTKIPNGKPKPEGGILQNAFLLFLMRYVGIPFIYIYFVILYAYTAKVLFHIDVWPKGQIPWMIIGFSSFGYIIYSLSESIEKKFTLVWFFRRWFPLAVLPQCFMLLYAIGVRIWQYDITVNRYFVAVFGIWLTVVSIYFFLSKARLLFVLPASLSVAILLISIGPWSIHVLPDHRQFLRLTTYLEQANILQNGKVVPLVHPKDVPDALLQEIRNGIEGLCDFRSCTPEVTNLFEGKLVLSEESDQKGFPLQIQEKALSLLGIPEPTIVSYSDDSTTQYTLRSNTGVFPLNTIWFEQVVVLGQEFSLPKTNTGSYSIIVSKKSEGTLYHGTEVVGTFSLQSCMEKIRQPKDAALTLEDMTCVVSIPWFSLQLIFDFIQFQKDGNLFTQGYGLIHKNPHP